VSDPSTPSSAELDRLLELQSIDDEARRLEHQLEGLEEQRELDALVAQDTTLAEGDVDLRDRLDRVQRDQRQVELEIEALQQRREEEQARLYAGSLTTGREVQAAEAEIASTARRRSEHEDQLLEIMEVAEDLMAQLADLSGVRERLAERIAAATAARDDAAQQLIARIAEVQVRRDPVAAALPADLLSRYEAAAKRGGGTGVGVLRENACSACRITFPMTEINGFFTGPPLTECTQCRRLLIVPA
jgi:predicted  nucleic acid-binding Zn-ribbon protein